MYLDELAGLAGELHAEKAGGLSANGLAIHKIAPAAHDLSHQQAHDHQICHGEELKAPLALAPGEADGQNDHGDDRAVNGQAAIPKGDGAAKVKLSIGGAETVQIEEQLVADGAYAVKPEDPTRAGYRFEGWYRDTEASEAFDFTQPIHADTVIYLKWTSLPQDVPAVPAENPSMDLGLILGIINGGSGMSFSDVTSSDWFFEDIAAAYQLGLMNGVSTYEFAPKAPLSRAMVAAMLYRMAGSPAAYYGGRQFTDGADGKWYSSVIRCFLGLSHKTSELS